VSGAPPPAIERIAVLRANALGDFLFAVPALEALRAAYPSAEITLLGAGWHRSFLADRPGPVDRIIEVPVADGVRQEPRRHEDRAELDRFFAAMAAERFDVAIQLHGGGRYTNPFVSRLGAGLTVGLQARDAPPLDLVVPYVYYQHEVLRCLEVVALLGARPVVLEPRVAVSEADRDEADAVFPPGGQPLALLHPGATDPRRRWPADRFAAIGNLLGERGYTVAVTGGADERDLTARVVADTRGEAHDLGGAVSLRGLTGLLARAMVVISNDTGPRHLAAAVGTPTVGVYWVGNMINAGPITRRLHRTALSWRTHCPVCAVDCTGDSSHARSAAARCAHNPSFLDGITVEEVWTNVDDLLKGLARSVDETAAT
jgi:ADP-heptose:LPS heptosyltransferase